MHDPRYEKLADILVGHSTKVQEGENVLIEAIDIPDEMVITLIRKVRERGGNPVVTLKRNRIQRERIRKDGLFVVEDLKPLNPDQL
jgi:aminopeptidase